MPKQIILIVFFVTKVIECQLSGLEPYCEFRPNNRELICSDFDSFDQLDFKKSVVLFSNVAFRPKDELKLKLDSKLNLDGLKMNSSSVPRIEFKNIAGFDTLFNPFLEIIFFNKSNLFDLKISNSNWSFDTFDCQVLSDSMNKSFLFSDLNVNELLIEDCEFSTPICSLIFKKSKVKHWIFNTLNPVKFEQITNQEEMSLDINVEKLDVKFGYETFVKNLSNQNLLNEHLFEKITDLEFRNCYLETIDGKSLEKFKYLKRLKLLGFNLKKLFQNGVDWMNSLGKQMTTPTSLDDFFELTLTYERIGNYFNFDDTDLCYFKEYTHSNLLVPLLYSGKTNLSSVLPCGCTIYWLYKNYKSYFDFLKNSQSQELKKVFLFIALK